MRLSLVLAAAAAAIAVAALGSVALDVSFQRAALLAPVLVVGAGAVVGLAVLWTRAARDSLRKR